MKVRKKLIEVEARQIGGDYGTDTEIMGWCSGYYNFDNGDADAETYLFTITTLEGDMNVHDKDWVIRGVKGEFYPCKPDIFAATYDIVED